MRALVTGGSGFIGSNVVKLLLSNGHHVVVLDNLSSGCRRNLDPFPEVRLFVGDVRDPAAVAAAVSGVDVVFHLAASVGNARSIENPIDDSEVNTLGTLRILEAARTVGVRKVVYSSSAAIFGELRTLPIREDHPAEPSSPYGVSKLAGEKHCLVYGKMKWLEVVCLRYFNVYGVNQRYDAYGNVVPIFAQRMLAGEPLVVFGDGEQTRDFVNVQDVAIANYRAALSDGASGVFNIGSGKRITVNRLILLMSGASGIEPIVTHAPRRPGDLEHSLADISAAREAFGYAPTVDLEAGLGQYMSWMRAERDSGGA
jgi:UDP-glucose 4-epimerase